MATDVFGERMDHDVGAMLDRAAQVGEGTVLSTMSGTPWRWAISASFSKSVILPRGLPTDSQ